MSTVVRPRISIVTPSFNQGRYIERTIRSVLLQRYPNLEYVVMDGGSTDETRDVIERYSYALHHWVSEPDGGQSDAIRRGMETTTGDILAYLNSDDVLLPGALDYVASYFEDHPAVDAIYSNRVMIDSSDEVIGYWVLPRHSSWLMTRWDLIPQETCFWRRRLFERAGNIDSSFRFAMDYDLFTRYMRCGTFQRLRRPLGAFRVHPESKTSTALATIGAAEVARIWSQLGIRGNPILAMIGHAFCGSVQLRSAHHAARRRALPGVRAGTGYSLDDLWGGMLSDGTLPSTLQPHVPSAIEVVGG